LEQRAVRHRLQSVARGQVRTFHFIEQSTAYHGTETSRAARSFRIRRASSTFPT
jgi:hypothetical protein